MAKEVDLMAEVRPFKGLLYDKQAITGDYASVMAPPYDVIPKNMRDELYEKNMYNVVKLILGRSLENDGPENNKYIRAKNFLNEWQKKGVLVRDDAESFYVYLQEYEYKGKKYRRTGFIGLIKIEDPDKDTVLPHEHTLAKPKEDRLNLIKQVRSNLSPIFTLFNDDTGEIGKILEECAAASDPVIDIETDGVCHKLWHLSDGASLKRIVSQMAGKKIFIADGHHRYEVARTYRDMRRQEEGDDGSADYIMMYFTDASEHDNLTVMATHRVIKAMPDVEVEAKLGVYFDITECDDLSGLMERIEGAGEDHVFGFYDGEKYLFMKPKDKSAILGLITEEMTDDWKQLDVSVLHSAVLNSILSVSGAEGNITYVRDPETAEVLVKDGSHMAAFFLNPTRVAQLTAVAEHGEMMPQKSTYFYPKLLTGLVINRFE